MNVPRAAPHIKQVHSEGGGSIPKRQTNLSLPCIPSDVDNWLSVELEKRGINPIIYGPTVISLLSQQSQSIPVSEQYNARVRAIEILLKASNGSPSTDDISRLVDEADNRLRQCKGYSQDFPAPGRASLGASPGFSSSHNIAAMAAAAVANGGKGPDEGFLEWSSSPKPVAAPVTTDKGEEEGELLLNEVSDMLQQFNMEVRHGVDIEAGINSNESPPVAEKPAPAEAAPASVVGIPSVQGRKRDASIDSGVGSFNWSNSRDCSNESSPPSALDWLSVSPGGGSIWSATSPALSNQFNAGASGHTGPLSADPPAAWSFPQSGQHQFRRMRFTSAPTYGDEDFPEISRHRGLSTSSGLGTPSGKKKKNGKAGVRLYLGQRQASPPSDSGSSSSGGSSPPASGQTPGSPSGGKSSLEKSRRACSFYLRGHCKKEDCEFAHDLTKVTCKFWMTGECFKGDTCPFLHGQLRS